MYLLGLLISGDKIIISIRLVLGVARPNYFLLLWLIVSLVVIL